MSDEYHKGLGKQNRLDSFKWKIYFLRLRSLGLAGEVDSGKDLNFTYKYKLFETFSKAGVNF